MPPGKKISLRCGWLIAAQCSQWKESLTLAGEEKVKPLTCHPLNTANRQISQLQFQTSSAWLRKQKFGAGKDIFRDSSKRESSNHPQLVKPILVHIQILGATHVLTSFFHEKYTHE